MDTNEPTNLKLSSSQKTGIFTETKKRIAERKLIKKEGADKFIQVIHIRYDPNARGGCNVDDLAKLEKAMSGRNDRKR